MPSKNYRGESHQETPPLIKKQKTKATIWLNAKTLKNKNKENITQVTQHTNKMERGKIGLWLVSMFSLHFSPQF